MSEVMTTESIVEGEWMLDGFWTKPRFQYRTGGGWGDIDVLAFHPNSGHMVISESKAQGKARALFAFTTNRNHQTFEQYIQASRSNYLGILNQIDIICRNEVVQELCPNVKIITVQLVCNIVIDESRKAAVQQELLGKIKDRLNRIDEFKNITINFQIDTHIAVISRILIKTRQAVEGGYGKRYGHPILDFARELNRYLDPVLPDLGKDEVIQKEIKEQAISTFLSSLGLPISNQKA